MDAVPLPMPNVDPALLQAARAIFSSKQNTDSEVAAVTLPIFDPPGLCLGEANDADRQRCVEYAYIAFYALILEYTGNPPTALDLLSTVYFTELDGFGADPIAAEALARNFFDYGSGGCRYDVINNTGYYCSYRNVIEWLGQMESWYSKVLQQASSTTVNLLALVSPSVIWNRAPEFRFFRDVAEQEGGIHDNSYAGGIFAYDHYVSEQISANLSAWRTGQSPGLPSAFGNQRIEPPGTRNIANFTDYNSSEHFVVWFFHVPRSGHDPERYIPGATPQPDYTDVTCTYVAVITSTDGTFGLSNC